MRFYQILMNYTRCSYNISNNLFKYNKCKVFYSLLRYNSNINSGFTVINNLPKNTRNLHTSMDKDEETEDLENLEHETADESDYARNILFQNSNDPIIIELNKTASIVDVFKVLDKYQTKYDSQHITQTIMVLYDLQKLFFDINNIPMNTRNVQNYMKQLRAQNQFKSFLEIIENKVNNFNSRYLSYTLLYLTKLGISEESELHRAMLSKCKKNLENNFVLEEAANFIKAVFSEISLKNYYNVLDIVPNVFNEIDICDNVEKLEKLTICLNKLNKFVTNNIMSKYRSKIEDFLSKNILTENDHKVILKVILFLNYPMFRNENVCLISDSILLIKDKIESFNVQELIILYEIFFKNQEPGEVLSTIQRTSLKYLQQIEDSNPSNIDTKLKLFSSLIYFSSPTHRVKFRKIMSDYVDNCTTFQNLQLLKKILSYIKVSDKNLCEKYWNNVLEATKTENITVYSLCQLYLRFNIDIDNYRYFKIESYIYKNIVKEIENGNITMFTSNLIDALCFCLTYSNNYKLIQYLITKLQESYTQIKYLDQVNLSQTLSVIKHNPNHNQNVETITKILNKSTDHLINFNNNFITTNLLLKSCIVRNDMDSQNVELLFSNFKNIETITSKIIENCSYCCISTNSLIPELINKICTYCVKNKENILGFNVEKILHLCFYLGYLPINSEEFFPTAANIIIRDQERLSGLSFLQSALSLCFFNKLPKSFIKQIFNVEFLDKLDLELANCYSKDKYPQRVRKALMELNRAVCMEYPENNVPWFHSKYIQEERKKNDFEQKSHFNGRVRDYLMAAVVTESNLLENVITPYGYHIDFVINFNSNNEAVPPNSSNVATKLAILLLRSHGFTRFYIQLKGKYQLKKRHLEMFGYTVSIINFDEWINLLYAGERIEFINNKIFPPLIKKICNN